MRTAGFRTAVLGVILFAALSASAKPVTIQFDFFDGGTAHAIGTVVVEDTALPNPTGIGGVFLSVPGPEVLSATITVSGATAGNGTFTNITGFAWDTNGGTLDLSKPLIGQPTPGGPWGPPGNGDFNFFTPAAPGPNGVFPFGLRANHGAANTMILASAIPVQQVPTLSEWPMVLLALLLTAAGFAALRRKRA